MSKNSNGDKNSAVVPLTSKSGIEAKAPLEAWRQELRQLVDEVVETLDCEDAFREGMASSDTSSNRPLPHSTSRHEMLAAASTDDTARVVKDQGSRTRSEDIAIDGIRCWFEYSEGPHFRVYLCGPVPDGILGFESGGRRWNIKAVEPYLYAIEDMELYHIDDSDGVGKWLR